MSKPIPVFTFAFIAFEMTSRGRSDTASKSTGSSDAGFNQLKPMNRSEGDRFDAAWRFTAGDRGRFSVCVRVKRLARSQGFRLLTAADAWPRQSECLWLNEIDQTAEGFFGQAQTPSSRLANGAAKQRISFALTNIVHWALATAETTRPKDEDASEGGLDYVARSREIGRP